MKVSATRLAEVTKIFAAKEQFHKERANLPIEEKIRILVELQKLAIKIPTVSKEDRFRMVWDI